MLIASIVRRRRPFGCLLNKFIPATTPWPERKSDCP
jgi:hypothetical protein